MALFVTLLAFCVILLGAYTRLKDAGLGCPDWPVCYGHLTVPESASAVAQVAQQFPGQTVEPEKAWLEMIHRYAAGTLGLLIFVLGFWGMARYRKLNLPLALPSALILLVIFQAALGMWTVTLKLMPLVVMGHLVGGFTVISLLWWMTLRSGSVCYANDNPLLPKLRLWAGIALAILIAQIILGGWTSTNYAALACPGLPFCYGWDQHQWVFSQAFQLWQPFENLSQDAKATIQLCHRVGAVLTTGIIGYMGYTILRYTHTRLLSNIALVMLTLLVVQVALGIMNVWLRLPIDVALAHNGCAALLLLSLVTLNHAVHQRPKAG
ncbi:MAG: COX15/CtaA family protein [Gammaproteobacteria bacterium]|nr:COX15/CtaA family protein [Gammaproteobacteria bacterium]